MGTSRQWVVDTLRRLGYREEADEASRELPDEVSRKQLAEFCDKHGVSRDALNDRMGGSP
jgi:hypothetical protein